MKNTCHWSRLLRITVAMMLVFSLLLCGCELPSLDGSNPTASNNNKPNDDKIPGDGDGKWEAQDVVDGVSAVYGVLLDMLGGNMEQESAMSMQSDLRITLGDELKANLAPLVAQMGLSDDLSWFESLGISSTSNMSGDLMQTIMDVKLNGKTLAGAEVISDMVKGMLYISLPGINDETLGMNTGVSAPGAPGSGPVAGSANSVLGMLTGSGFADLLADHKELVAALPSEAQINSLLTAYLNVALECLDEGTKSTAVLTQGDVSQNVDATTYVITLHDLADAGIAIVNRMKTDVELKAALDAFSVLINAIAAEQNPEAEQVDLYKAISDVADEMLEDMEETKLQAENQDVLRFTGYTCENKTVGFKLDIVQINAGAEDFEDNVAVKPLSTDGEAEDVTCIICYNLEDQGKTAFCFEVVDMVKFSGNGTVKDGKVSGNYTLLMQGREFLLVEVKDFTADLLNAEALEGTLRLRPGKDLKPMLPNNFLINENVMVELQLHMDGESVAMAVKLYSGDKFMVGLDMTNIPIAPQPVKVPAEYVNIMDEEAMNRWMENMDLEAVLDKLEAAGAPAELVQMLLQMISSGNKPIT